MEFNIEDYSGGGLSNPYIFGAVILFRICEWTGLTDRAVSWFAKQGI